MKKAFLLTVLSCLTICIWSVDIEISTGLGYGLYGVSAQSSGVKADIYYHSAGLELGVNLIPDKNWETRLTLFAGLPLGADVYKNGLYYISPDLTVYNQYRHHISAALGVSYRYDIQDLTLAAGPYGIINNVVLSSRTLSSTYLYSHTLGIGLAFRGEYDLDMLGIYAEIRTHMNFYEYMAVHSDFVPSLSGGLTLGVLWRI